MSHSNSSALFAPEWLVKKANKQPSKQQQPPTSPTPPVADSPTPPSSYSSLLTPSMQPTDNIQPEDQAHPFRYSKDAMIRIWKEGGGRGGLGLEVERWPGIVREDAGEPIGLREWTPEELKVFAQPLNSTYIHNPTGPLRRHSQSHLSLSNTALGNSTGKSGSAFGGALGSPRSDRFGASGGALSGGGGGGGWSGGASSGRRWKDENGNDAPFPRRPSLSSLNTSAENSHSGPVSAPKSRLTPGFEGVFEWGRRRTSNAGDPNRPNTTLNLSDGEALLEENESGIHKDDEEEDTGGTTTETPSDPLSNNASSTLVESLPDSRIMNGTGPPPGIERPRIETVNNLDVMWCYKDPAGNIQGPFSSQVMQKWYEERYFTPDLLIRRQHPPLEDPEEPPFAPLVDYMARILAPDKNLFLRGMELIPLRPQPFLGGAQTALTPNALSQLPQHTISQSFGHSPSPSPNSLQQGPIGGYHIQTPSRTSSNLETFNVHSTSSLSSGSVGSSPAFASALPVGPTLATTAPSAAVDEEQKRRERIEFLRSLRERELAEANNSGVGGVIGAGRSQPLFSSTAATQSHQAVPRPAFSNPDPTNVTSIGQPFASSFNSAWPDGSRSALAQPNAFQQHPSQSFGPEYGVPSPYPANTTSTSPWNSVPPSTAPNQQSPFNQSTYPLGQQPNYLSSPLRTEPVVSAIRPWNQYPQPDAAPQPSIPALSDLTINDASPVDPISPAPIEVRAQERREDVQQVQQQNTESSIDTPASPQADDSINVEASASVAQPREETPSAPSLPSPKSRKSHLAQAAASKPRNAMSPSTLPAISTSSSSKSTPLAAALLSSPTAPPKQAWSLPSASSDAPVNSLREIQEAEAKKAEARKVLEKSKERGPRGTSSTFDDSIGNTSWGLPQLGARTTSQGSVPTSTTPATAPWTTAAVSSVTTKKSMKEILEEEERRKKESSSAAGNAISTGPSNASASSNAMAAAKRGYADSAKVTAAPGAPWVTVGANGKTGLVNPQSAPTAVPRQPSLQSSSIAKTTGLPGVQSATSSRPASSSSQQAPKPQAKTTSTMEEAPIPSADFMKWLRDALKGLSGVNVDEFIQMLLSFPLDPAPSVMEIISDSVYANSSTLDGRRFTADFCARRKADAVNTATKGNNGSKPLSLADVVKTQPKPPQSEWAYKVVKKKGKGGRQAH